MEHKVHWQSYNLQPSAMVERDTGSITTPLAAFDRRTSDCDHYNLHPFGSDLFVVTQPNQRISAMDKPTWRATYLFSGSYNPFTHIYSNAPRAHVVIKESGQLQITGRVVFFDLGGLPPAARSEVLDEPDASSTQPPLASGGGTVFSDAPSRVAAPAPMAPPPARQKSQRAALHVMLKAQTHKVTCAHHGAA